MLTLDTIDILCLVYSNFWASNINQISINSFVVDIT